MKPADSTSVTGVSLTPVLLRVAWLSILLGLSIEILLLVVTSFFGKKLVFQVAMAETIQKISWSIVVCSALALARVFSAARPLVSGLAGLLSAPIGFIIAGAAQKGVAQALSVPTSSSPSPSAAVLALLKGLEYAWLGIILAWVGYRYGNTVRAFALSGLTAGVLFGSMVLFLFPPMAIPVLASRAVNEVLFPVGCSIILFSAETFKKEFSAS